MRTPKGFVRTFSVDERTGLWLPRAATSNAVLHNWGYLAYLLFGKGRAEYKLSAMYLEFENVASPGDPVTAPGFGLGPADGRPYYAALTGTRDYLRVPIEGEPTLEIGAGYGEHFTEGETGNQAVFRAVSAGTAGVNGLTFGAAQNSVVYGLALVAAPRWGDVTQDVVYGRAYYTDPADQLAKEVGKQVGVSWEQLFGEELG